MEPGISWYDVLGVLPGAEATKIRREYDAKTSLRQRHGELTIYVWHPPAR